MTVTTTATTATTSSTTTAAATDTATIGATTSPTTDATGWAGASAAGGLEDSPTDRWLAVLGERMTPLTGPAGVAERLLLLIHYGIDWQNGWVSRYRRTYWEQLLPDRVITATYRAGTLRRWWRDVASELGSAPRNAAERTELEQLLRADSTPVLMALRLETEALLLRTRIVADAVRDTRSTPGAS
ncbi:hypothetical protein SAMN05661080_04134 [Modestobacter sp. DSM 44400]|uniref:hypothetical protein n=1 Tax=Modestobacter sp. DSM 44400 TaxID=1550230 RepID=UPI0008983DC9|nr:hypothetical protein [Modestobacter sp. DSM 44400]SDY63951.1 hypothetical protein SAMN05661080_04134 [Modestobacter sp. DSM 44400]